ncbi:MAG: response regulator [Acidobacteria bacterium]|nr:response regulator [Acidobacteriota bacterium]
MALKVLIVEDDAPTLELMSEILTSLKVEVRPVSDGQQVAALVSREKFDGIFLDLMMPRVDGFELARQIRRSSWNKSTPIVIVTGREDRQTMAQAFKAGGTFFLRKPIDRGRLTRLLNSTRGTMLEERRRLRRIPIAIEVCCQSGFRKITGMSSNLGLNGILFQGDSSLVPGSRVRLSFRLAGQDSALEAEGIIARVDEEHRAGVRFTQISAQHRQRLRELIVGPEETA